MKHLFKCAFLVLGLMLLTFSCQKDNFEDEQLEVLQEENAKNNLFKKGKLSDYSEVKDFVKTLKNNKHEGNMAFRTSMETSNAFIILENQDIAIHSGDAFNTYTIPIVKLEQPEHTFSNLVVQFSVASDSTSAYILTYNPNPGYFEDYAMDDQTAFSGAVTYEPLDYDGSLDNLQARVSCEAVTITYCRNGKTGGTGSTHQAGPGCTVIANMWTEHYTLCTATDDGGSDPYTIEPPSGPGGGGTGSSTNSPNTGSSTSTIPANLINVIDNDLDFDLAEIDWLSDNFHEAINIYFYLQENADDQGNIDQEALDFVEVAMDTLVNGGEVDFENEIIFDSSFNDYDCQKNMIDEITRVCGPLSELFQEIFINSNRAQLTFKAEPMGILTGGFTSYAGANNNGVLFETTLNTNRLINSTNLDIITTTVHEYTHAILLYFFKASLNFNIDLENPPSYAALAEQFSLYRTTIGNTNQTQHEYMASLVDDIAQVSYNWCQENNVEVTLEYLKKISWGGLKTTTTFDVLYPENTMDRLNITDAIRSEIFPNVPGENPIGTLPCD